MLSGDPFPWSLCAARRPEQHILTDLVPDEETRLACHAIAGDAPIGGHFGNAPAAPRTCPSALVVNAEPSARLEMDVLANQTAEGIYGLTRDLIHGFMQAGDLIS